MTPEGHPGDAPAPSAHRVYDGAEVDGYLAELQRRLDSLRAELSAANDRAEAAERRLQDSAWSEALIGRTLVLAQRTAERAVREAQDEAGATLAHASERALDHLLSSQAQAEARIDEATRQARRILDEARKSAAPVAAPGGHDVRGLAPPPTPRPPVAPAAPSRFEPPPLPGTAALDEPPVAPSTSAAAGGNVPETSGRVINAGPSSSPTDAASGGSSVILDMRDRWRAARSGSVALFEADDDRVATSDYFAQLRSAVAPEVDVQVPPGPAARSSAFEDASYLVAFPAWASPSRSVVEMAAAVHAENDRRDGEANGDDDSSKPPGPLGRLGSLMLGMVSPAPMAHRRRRHQRG